MLAEFLDKPLWDASGVNMLKGIGKDFISKWSEIMEEYPSGDSEGVDMKRVMGEVEDKIESEHSRR